MKKAFTLLCLSWALGSPLQASDWRQQLVDLNPGVIDSVSEVANDPRYPELSRSYMIHYHQPLQHDNPSLGDLPLRALLSVRKDEDFTRLMTQVYIGGYDVDSLSEKYPNYYFAYNLSNSRAELANRYNGNLLQPEHRYFGESCPENPWTTLGYCEAKEAAADFHALLGAMKKVFTGKWAISGVSKGGITTAMQHAFYPDDADCFVPYSGPFLGYYHDLRMQEYYMVKGWNQELNEKMLHIQRLMTSREELIYYYCLSLGIDPAEGMGNPSLAVYFAYCVSYLDFSLRAYTSREQMAQTFAANEEVLRQHGLEDYTNEMLYFMLAENTILIDQKYFDWYQQHFVTPEATANGPHRTCARLKDGVRLEIKHRQLLPVFGVDENSWNSVANIVYNYQAAHELGYYNLRFDYYFDDPEVAAGLNELWQSTYNNVLEYITNHFFADVEYNPDLLNFVRQQTAQAQKPILFIYGQDDPWTGAHMEDEYVNGDNVRLYILPEQNHTASITAVTDADLQNELWAFTDAIFLSTTGIRTLQDDASAPVRYYDLFGRRVSEQSLRSKLVLKR